MSKYNFGEVISIDGSTWIVVSDGQEPDGSITIISRSEGGRRMRGINPTRAKSVKAAPYALVITSFGSEFKYNVQNALKGMKYVTCRGEVEPATMFLIPKPSLEAAKKRIDDFYSGVSTGAFTDSDNPF